MSDQAVSDVLLFTQDMMLLVIEEHWEKLKSMQLQQDNMLRQLFSHSTPVFSQQGKDDLLEVQRLNQQIFNAAVARKTDIADELRSMRQGKAKANAYQAL